MSDLNASSGYGPGQAAGQPPGPGLTVGADDKTMTIVVYVLYLLGFLTGGLTAVVGVIMAYVLKPRASPRAVSHYVFQIRTFWVAALWLVIGALVVGVGAVLTIILIGFPIMFVGHAILVVTAVWYAVRSSLGLIAAVGDRPYDRPRAWLI